MEFVASLWSQNPKMLIITLGSLFVNGVIDIEALAEWVFATRSVTASTLYYTRSYQAPSYHICHQKRHG